MAPGGDRLARLWFGNTVIDEVDYRQKAAACAWRDAGREFHAKRAEEQAPAPSSSHYSSGATNSGRTLQRRDTVGGRTGGGTVGARDTTRAGAGSSSQRLIVDPYGVGPAGAEGSQRRTGQQVARMERVSMIIIREAMIVVLLAVNAVLPVATKAVGRSIMAIQRWRPRLAPHVMADGYRKHRISSKAGDFLTRGIIGSSTLDHLDNQYTVDSGIRPEGSRIIAITVAEGVR
ncbi:MAG: hypothetical protein LQ338_004933 [Usnochroma carphineum]|nr:MAG: hypothetical protein LQ338_004933 [Usnochroma carphineum]